MDVGLKKKEDTKQSELKQNMVESISFSQSSVESSTSKEFSQKNDPSVSYKVRQN